jgi:hypothetical protein
MTTKSSFRRGRGRDRRNVPVLWHEKAQKGQVLLERLTCCHRKLGAFGCLVVPQEAVFGASGANPQRHIPKAPITQRVAK